MSGLGLAAMYYEQRSTNNDPRLVVARLLALIAVLLFACAAAAGDAVPTVADPMTNKRAVQLGEKLRCLVCQNQSIEESNAELAVDLRRQIREMIAQGKSDANILDFMVQRYGDFVLYQPPFKRTTLLLWLGPGLLFVTGLVILIYNLRRRRAQRDEQPLSTEQQKQAELLLAAGSDRERR